MFDFATETTKYSESSHYVHEYCTSPNGNKIIKQWTKYIQFVDLHNQIIRKYLELLIFIINDFCSHGVQLILAIITCSGWSINYVITFWGPQRPPSPFPGILVTSQRKLLLISSMKKRFLAGFNFPGAVFGPQSHLHWHDNDILQTNWFKTLIPSPRNGQNIFDGHKGLLL